MSTNKTPNYQLHSWVKEDKFLMSEINENFTALDGKLHEEVTALDGQIKAEAQARTQQLAQKADKTEITALTGQLAAKADGATLSALQTALGEKVEVAIGTYKGSGISGKIINLGRRPLAVHIERDGGSRSQNSIQGGLFLLNSNANLELTDTGFTLTNSVGLNEAGAIGVYMAFF